jgi:hypothetical protein
MESWVPPHNEHLNVLARQQQTAPLCSRCRWVERSEIAHPKASVAENARLKRLVAEQVLGNQVLKGCMKHPGYAFRNSIRLTLARLGCDADCRSPSPDSE